MSEERRSGSTPERAAREEWQRRRRLAEVFEERDPEDEGRDLDAWLRAQVPPHHGQ